MMFVPPHYAASDAGAIIRRYPFATLVTTGPAGLHATATPVFFETDAQDERRLVGHIARRNPQASDFRSGQHALIVFSGPNAYVSGRWYREKPQVPTWNYIAAQVRGTLEPLDSPEENLDVLRRTAQQLGRGRDDGWTMEDAPEGRVDALLPYIRSFRIHASDIAATEKLSQTHPLEDRLRVIANLTCRAEDGDLAIARLMARRDTG